MRPAGGVRRLLRRRSWIDPGGEQSQEAAEFAAAERPPALPRLRLQLLDFVTRLDRPLGDLARSSSVGALSGWPATTIR
jgi:hypothetical protein